jgi:serine/threonine-protein phosphatase 2A regulatory subunit B''
VGVFDRQLAPQFFNALCNLNKFVAHETRDPHSIRLQRAAPQMTDWERFAQLEYIQMATEEDEGDGDGMEVLDLESEPQSHRGTREAPF